MRRRDGQEGRQGVPRVPSRPLEQPRWQGGDAGERGGAMDKKAGKAFHACLRGRGNHRAGKAVTRVSEAARWTRTPARRSTRAFAAVGTTALARRSRG